MPNLYNAYTCLADRQIGELIDLAKGAIVGGDIAQQEAEFVLEWLEKKPPCRK